MKGGRAFPVLYQRPRRPRAAWATPEPYRSAPRVRCIGCGGSMPMLPGHDLDPESGEPWRRCAACDPRFDSPAERRRRAEGPARRAHRISVE